MKILNVIEVIVAMTIIGLAGIAAAVAASSLLLVQSVNGATTDVVTSTTAGGGGEAASTTTATTTNNNSDAILGSLFLTAESELTSFNPINETYIEISFADNSTIMPPNATGTTINATETGNATLNIQPNGLTIAQGQGFFMTQDDEAAQEENATATFVELSRVGPDGTGSGTGVVFYYTNSTGQLAFLDNMIAIFQHEISPEGDTLRIWEWKGGTIPFENGGSDAATATTGNNQTTTTTATPVS